MERKITYCLNTVVRVVMVLSALIISSLLTMSFGQSACTSSRVLFTENFGAGTDFTENADIVTPRLTFSATGSLTDGSYRVCNNTNQLSGWLESEDHTAGDINGKMLVVNGGDSGSFYIHQIDLDLGFPSSDYKTTFFLMNVNSVGLCAPNPLLPDIRLGIEYLSQDNAWLPLIGSPITSGPVDQSADPTWISAGAIFSLPFTGTFLVRSIRIVISDITGAGCGNDFAIDDITFSQCPEVDPTPVTFVNISARQKGSGASVEWSTSQELNSKSFVIEKSADGNTNWNVLSVVGGAGNSQTVKNYNAYDAQPFKGINFYRIKQVDKDGNFKYSKTVSVKLNFIKTGVSVIANPFHNGLTIDFASSTTQVIYARLVDITGKQVASERWPVTIGSTRKDFPHVSGLQEGIYILTVSNAAGEILYNNKVIKQ